MKNEHEKKMAKGLTSYHGCKMQSLRAACGIGQHPCTCHRRRTQVSKIKSEVANGELGEGTKLENYSCHAWTTAVAMYDQM